MPGLMEAISRELAGAGDTAVTIGKNALMQPIAGLAGLGRGTGSMLSGMRRGRGMLDSSRAAIEDAIRTINEIQGLAGGPETAEGGRNLEAMGNAIDYVGDAIGNPVDRAGEASPLAGALLAGAGAVVDPTKVSRGVKAAASAAKRATVMRPQRVAYPGIYDDPRTLVAEAASRVAPEDPLLKRLFGVTRDDLWQISEQGRRKGNITERPFEAAANPKGAAHAGEVMNPRNVARLQDIIGEAQQHPGLYRGMASWYTMDPLFAKYADMFGATEAVPRYKKFNTLTGMASPGSEVLTEYNRGTAAHWLDDAGRFDDFQRYGGLADDLRGADFPDDMRGVMGHPYHSTAQSGPMAKYLEGGVIDMGSAKVPSYIDASGVPETGFQTQWPVGDAHWSRLVGLPDVRGARTSKGVEKVPNASASVPEMTVLGPWWKDKVAAPMDLEAVPAQAVVWGAGSGATGVTSPIGAGKLELLAQQVGKAAARMNVTPEKALDMILRGKAHAGVASPELLAAIAAAGLGSVAYSHSKDEK